VTTSPADALALDGIEKAYGSLRVLRGFSGVFTAGSVAALVGPNGAGKTTLLRIAAGLQRADAGTVRGRALYYGGFEMLPVGGTINRFRAALNLPAVPGGERRMSTLSRGELQQTGLDASFALAPGALLLDEPWTALEPDARETLNNSIRAFAVNHAIVCSSHDLDEVARIADVVFFLSDGKPTVVRRDDLAAGMQRDDLIRVYRQSKQA